MAPRGAAKTSPARGRRSRARRQSPRGTGAAAADALDAERVDERAATQMSRACRSRRARGSGLVDRAAVDVGLGLGETRERIEGRAPSPWRGALPFDESASRAGPPGGRADRGLHMERADAVSLDRLTRISTVRSDGRQPSSAPAFLLRRRAAPRAHVAGDPPMPVEESSRLTARPGRRALPGDSGGDRPAPKQCRSDDCEAAAHGRASLDPSVPRRQQ